MIIPCIDLQDGKVVQLIQGQKKALEGAPPLEMLERFKGFPVIQVIDLDAAMGKGLNLDIVRDLASRARTRVGGGVRTADRARELVKAGAERVIVGTAERSGASGRGGGALARPCATRALQINARDDLLGRAPRLRQRRAGSPRAVGLRLGA